MIPLVRRAAPRPTGEASGPLQYFLGRTAEDPVIWRVENGVLG